MCRKREEKNRRFIHHNYYFLSWLAVVKDVKLEPTKNNNGFFIIGLSKEKYEEYKEEYKITHKDVLKKINDKVDQLKSKK